jgi:hypothetical protein
MCRYHNQFKNVLQVLADLGFATNNVVQQVQMLLPWMHAFDHDLSCQLRLVACIKMDWEGASVSKPSRGGLW